MKNPEDRNNSLQELVDVLTSPGLSGNSDTLVDKNELKKTQVYRRSWSSENLGGSVEEVINLVISTDNTPRLLRFTGQLEEALHDQDTYGSIMHMAPFCERNIAITIMAQPVKIDSLVDKLRNMPEVEKVEVELLTDTAISGFPQRFGFLMRLGTSPSKKVCVTLKEPVLAEKKPESELVPVLV